ncbi:MAG: copper chaperone PCu(A)C [Anaerolineales bacterium]
MKRFCLVFFFAIFAGIASSCGGSGTLAVRDAWARPANAGQNSAIYFVMDNATRQDDTLLSIQGEIADALEVHLSAMDANGVVSMQPQESVFVPAREEVVFEPGGLHVMVLNVKEDLQPGDTFRVVLTFRNAGEISLEVPVQEP